jgi:hypothetical protein
LRGTPIFAIEAVPASASRAARGKARDSPSGAPATSSPKAARRRSVSVRARDRHLLAEHGPRCEFKPVERAGRAHAGLLLDGCREALVARQMRIDRRHVGVEIERAAPTRSAAVSWAQANPRP